MTNAYLFLLQLIFLSACFRIARYYGVTALSLLFVTCVFLCNLLVLKTVRLFGLTVTTCDGFSVIALLCLNRIQVEKDAAFVYRLIVFSCGITIMLCAAMRLHLLFIPDASDTFHTLYVAMLTPLLHAMMMSVLVFFATQLLDVWLFKALSTLFKKQASTGLTIMSIAISQCFDTAAFTALVFWGKGWQALNIFLFSYAIKMLTMVVVCPLSVEQGVCYGGLQCMLESACVRLRRRIPFGVK